MNYQYINFNNQKDLIADVVLRKLIIHQDETGLLFETLRRDWPDVFNNHDLNFVMQYVSITPPNVIRDEHKWHVHKNQKDRFICIKGRIVTTLYDGRKNSKTYNKLNLLVMGPQNKNEMYVVIIPERVYHAFMVVSRDPGYLLNFPTQLYNPSDEGRIDNHELNWSKVRADFNLRK